MHNPRLKSYGILTVELIDTILFFLKKKEKILWVTFCTNPAAVFTEAVADEKHRVMYSSRNYFGISVLGT